MDARLAIGVLAPIGTGAAQKGLAGVGVLAESNWRCADFANVVQQAPGNQVLGPIDQAGSPQSRRREAVRTRATQR